jgi:biopolymer transport protein ExbB
MSAILDLMRQGGFVMIPIVILSCVLYERCVHLLLSLYGSRRWLRREGLGRITDRTHLQLLQDDFVAGFRHHRQLIGVLVAAAPLLGLLGTVIGMVNTFDSLAARHFSGSTEGLARGISMALITTEAGLAVAIPAVLMLYYAQRQLQKGLQDFIQLERRFLSPLPVRP